MEKFNFVEFISWFAIVILSVSYWFQIYKIHVHKEVRDLSMLYYICLVIGFTIMAWRAWEDNSTIFLIKQFATLVPSIIIVCQIYYHRHDHWHDKNDPNCLKCNKELELEWHYCAYCGTSKES